jgi:hypothetical protein
VLASDVVGGRASTIKISYLYLQVFDVLEQPYAGLLVSAPTLNPQFGTRPVTGHNTCLMASGLRLGRTQLSLLSRSLTPDDSERLSVT